MATTEEERTEGAAQEGDGRDHFNGTGQVTEPLAESDDAEHLHHLRCAGKLQPAGIDVLDVSVTVPSVRPAAVIVAAAAV